MHIYTYQKRKKKIVHIIAYTSKCIKPFDGANATLSDCFEDCIPSSNTLCVPDPTTPTFTHGAPAALRKMKIITKMKRNLKPKT